MEGDTDFVISGGISVPGPCRQIPALVACPAGSADACGADALPRFGSGWAGVLWHSVLG